jgi:flagellar motor switch protein FliG
MATSSKRKAAMLLMTLDAATASELLKGQTQEVVQEIAMEMSHLDATGEANQVQAAATAKEFCDALQKSFSGGMHVKTFVNSILNGSAGREKAAELHAQMQKAIHDKDPFLAISSASSGQIAMALDGEPPQAIALVLSALPSNLSTNVLIRLPEETGLKAIWKMTKPGEVSAKTIRRVGEMICKRLVELTSDDGAAFEEVKPKETLRKVAIVLSGLEKEKRDAMIEEIEGNDDETAKMVKALMVTWEDIIKIEDKSLQECLRKVDAGILAKALHGAEAHIVEKIRSNISERAAEMVDEEAGLMGDPRKKDIIEARETVAQPLRDANEAEELAFIEKEE